MGTKLLFIVIRGIRLFLNYFKGNILSILALSALFLILHTAFSLGGGIARFADSAARFDTLRVYPSEKVNLQTLAKSAERAPGVESVTVYSRKDTKEYIKQNAPAINGIDTLPDGIFPPFLEVIAAEGYRNVDSLEQLSARLKDLPGVESVSYGQEWAKRLSGSKNAVSAILFIAVIVFAAAGAVIIYQTVSVTLYKYRGEIRVYSVVGGTGTFITWPFAVLSVCIGALCAAVSLLAYLILHMAFLSSLEDALGLTLSLSRWYCLAFFIAALAVTKLAGFVSAANFLNKTYEINEG